MAIRRLMTILTELLDTPGDGGAGGGAGAGGAEPAANSGAAATGGTPAGDGQARTGAASTGEKSFTYKEDRSKWVDPASGQYIPKHRFDEANTTAKRARELEAQLAESNRKVAALSGVSPADPNAQKAEQIKEAFFGLPGMARFKKLLELDDERFDKILSSPDQIDRTAQAEDRAWQRHADQQVNYIGEKIADAMGVEKPDGELLDDLRTNFSAWIKKSATAEIERTGKSDVIARYERGDQKLLDEYVAQYTKRWVEPARRQQTAQAFNRTRPVPSSTGRSQVSSVQRPEKFKSMDERIEYASNLAKERGVQFGRQ